MKCEIEIAPELDLDELYEIPKIVELLSRTEPELVALKSASMLAM